MPPLDLAALNTQFAIPEQLSFVAGPGDLPFVDVRNAQGLARISIQGGQVVAFQPHGTAPVLWVSAASLYAPDKPIRGGIPVCWPWFGPHPTDPTKRQHGFVRTALWSVGNTRVTPEGATQIQLTLADSPATRALWPHPFALAITITVGTALVVELVAHNPGPDPVSCSGALHSYFSVSNVTSIAIQGLEGCTYIDKTAGGAQQLQQGPVTLDGETDRIYLETAAPCVIVDPERQRRIHIAKQGSRSTVVWNPGEAGARRMSDFGAEEYRRMVCVETANAGPDAVTIPPGGAHRLGTTITVEQDEVLSSKS
ncbi:MAG TPA: D-hexose-6-phosphate mutarotase [Chloroflexia bacterium]|nr:D-hexose-6-phosphate mutarotase [Chloroflexia bacterium]